MAQFRKILVANRGEVALRVIRACRELGIKSVAVYSEADRDSLHVRFADEAVCIGPAASAQSYLNIPRIISAAEITDADAIHPGYGFLSENPTFSEVCAECKIKFIGPDAETIRKMGDKAVAKKSAMEGGVPVVPGSDGVVETPEEAARIANEIGYPVIVKASAGGGGRGMRIAHTEMALKNAMLTASSEAETAFGNGEVYIERYFENPRHVEVQVLGDEKGNIIHLGERDCSVQRRHQKLIEESPCPVMTPELREKMGDAAIAAARVANYAGAGTVEFLLDDDGTFCFMEMNTRVQVEHPVTEAITGVDIIAEQIRVAAGQRLRLKQEDVKIDGHAIECRINAENPDKDFMPSPGRIEAYHPPGGPGVRVDSHVYQEYVIPPYYDSMIAKLIVHSPTRRGAIARMRRALNEFIVEGVFTTIPFHQRVLRNAHFIRGEFGTDFIDTCL